MIEPAYTDLLEIPRSIRYRNYNRSGPVREEGLCDIGDGSTGRRSRTVCADSVEADLTARIASVVLTSGLRILNKNGRYKETADANGITAVGRRLEGYINYFLDIRRPRRLLGFPGFIRR